MEIKTGVPQASVFDPVLYVLNTNDIPPETDIATFAIGTVLLTLHENPDTVKKKVHKAWDEFSS